MPRKRMLDPSLWDDPDLAQLSPLERLLFIGFISLADDYGHLSASPALLRKWVFGYDEISNAQVKAMRDKILATCRNVQLYNVDGQEYLWLRTWERHQDLRYRAKAQYPCHACGSYHTASNYDLCTNASLVAPTLRSPAQDLTQPLRPDYVTLHDDTLSHEEGKLHDNTAPNGADIQPSKPPKRSSGPKGHRPRQATEENLPSSGFEEFWEAYPRKIARSVALRAYSKALLDGCTSEAMFTGAGNYSQECIMTARERQFICFPATFLNQRRFEDYQEPPSPADFRPRFAPNGRAELQKQGPEYETFRAPKRANTTE